MNNQRLIGCVLALIVIWLNPVLADDKVCLADSGKATVNTVNINTASAEQLSAQLKGVGKAKAAAIIQWRETNGKFSSLEDVDEVKGIGPALLEKNKAVIRFEDE